MGFSYTLIIRELTESPGKVLYIIGALIALWYIAKWLDKIEDKRIKKDSKGMKFKM